MKDCIIIGGGLAGSILADFLSSHLEVIVLDSDAGQHSSKVAAGIFNPVTGRRMTKSWMVDTIGPFGLEYYQQHEKKSGHSLVQIKNIKRLFHNEQQRDEWLQRVEFQNLEGIIKGQLPEDADHPIFKMEHGGVETAFSWRLDTIPFLDWLHSELRQKGMMETGSVNYDSLHFHDDHIQVGGHHARRVVFAEGYRMLENPWFNYLPMRPNKGELLVIEADGIDDDALIQKRIFLLHLGGNRYKVGATYERDNLQLDTSNEKRDWLLERLDAALKVPYKVVGQESGIRPAVRDRRPLIGQHHEQKNLWIFNGFGSKGVSQIPWCAEHFMKHWIERQPLLKELDVARFLKLVP